VDARLGEVLVGRDGDGDGDGDGRVLRKARAADIGLFAAGYVVVLVFVLCFGWVVGGGGGGGGGGGCFLCGGIVSFFGGIVWSGCWWFFSWGK
jgi:hypothetical protein